MAKHQNTLDGLQQVSIKELVGFLAGPKAVRENKNAILSANIAVRSLAAVGRIKATERARDATQLMVLTHISENKAEFRKYVKIAMPHLNPIKQIAAR